MKVRVLARHVPNVGRKGDERTIDDPSAKVLILLGKVERVIDPPKRAIDPPKRVYKRKDILTAAPLVVEPPVYSFRIKDESDE